MLHSLAHGYSNFVLELTKLTMGALTKELQRQITPERALELLKEGNQRFSSDKCMKRNHMESVCETANEQNPYAVILSCIDSRTPSSLVFDLGIGDFFSIRVAGNVVNEDVLGSMEYACKVVESKIILVLGHSKCGAVSSACKHVEMGHISQLLHKIEPSVQKVAECESDITSDESVQKVAELNVFASIEEIRAKSPILKEMEEKGEIKIVGGMYNVETGLVDFYE